MHCRSQFLRICRPILKNFPNHIKFILHFNLLKLGLSTLWVVLYVIVLIILPLLFSFSFWFSISFLFVFIIVIFLFLLSCDRICILGWCDTNIWLSFFHEFRLLNVNKVTFLLFLCFLLLIFWTFLSIFYYFLNALA